MPLKTSFSCWVALPCVHSRYGEADVKCEVQSSIKGLSFHDNCQLPSVSSMNICTAISCRPSTIEIVSFIKEHCLGSIKDHPLNDMLVSKINAATLIQDTCTLASRMISAATSFKNHSLTRGLLEVPVGGPNCRSYPNLGRNHRRNAGIRWPTPSISQAANLPILVMQEHVLDGVLSKLLRKHGKKSAKLDS